MQHPKFSWQTPRRPAELTEDRLVTAILDGTFPINSALPSERELAEQLGVTRPTLREALQRLSRDGWVEIHHGKTTRVRDYWREGNLLILTAIARHREIAQYEFVTQLLEVRLVLAPEYARLAIENDPARVDALLRELLEMKDTPAEFSCKDFDLHKQLTVLSGNPIFTLILNGFGDLYQEMGEIYFANPLAREASRSFYSTLRTAIQANDTRKAYEVVRDVMAKSIEYWKAASQHADLGPKESD